MTRAPTALLALLVLPLGACTGAGTDEGNASGGSASVAPAAEEGSAEPPAAEPAAAGFYGLSTTTLEGEPAELSAWAGQVALVVNTASRCGYTPQYAGLQALSERYAERGLVVMGFPSNDFGSQEPGTPQEIRAFCTQDFGVTFPMFSKQRTQPGADQSPVYAFLQEATGEVPDWNFCKYLVNRQGQVVGFWKSRTAPDSAELQQAIEKALEG